MAAGHSPPRTAAARVDEISPRRSLSLAQTLTHIRSPSSPLSLAHARPLSPLPEHPRRRPPLDPAATVPQSPLRRVVRHRRPRLHHLRLSVEASSHCNDLPELVFPARPPSIAAPFRRLEPPPSSLSHTCRLNVSLLSLLALFRRRLLPLAAVLDLPELATA